MEIVEEGDEALHRMQAEESAFWRWLRADHALRVLMRRYALFNMIDAYVLAHLPEEHRPIAALLLTHHTDEQIIARLAVDQAAIDQVRHALMVTIPSIVPAWVSLQYLPAEKPMRTRRNGEPGAREFVEVLEAKIAVRQAAMQDDAKRTQATPDPSRTNTATTARRWWAFWKG
jgi:hypothetical protein